jgi:hypothetical protein
MAWKGPWGCYIHIPKTSGSWTRRVLAQKGGERDGMTHSLPLAWIHNRYFTVVRPPVDWLRSVWRDREKSRWQVHPEKCPYRDFTKILIRYRTKDFEEFIERITTKERGIVGWLYGCYTPPQVEIVRIGEEQIAYLKKLKCNPDAQAPVNVSGRMPEITPQIRQAVFEAEMVTYGRLGFDFHGTYLKHWRGT